MSDSEYEISKTRRRVRGWRPATRKAFLGNETGRIDVPGRPGYVWVRYPAGATETGQSTLSPAVAVRSGIGAGYVVRWGMSVVIGKDEDGADTVLRGGWQQTLETGVNPSVSNPLRPETRWFNNDNYTPLISLPVGTGNSPSTRVTVYPWVQDNDNGDYRLYRGTEFASQKVNLAPYIPISGQHCYAVVWLDTFTQLPSVTASVPQLIGSDLDSTDLQECFAARPADSVPIKAYYLSNNQGAVVQSDRHIDLRQLVNTPTLLGDPMPINRALRLWPGRTLTTRSVTLLPGGSLEVHGDINLATGSGTGGGAGGAFTVAGQTGTPQTISAGDTLSILGSTGVTTTASATDTLTVGLAEFDGATVSSAGSIGAVPAPAAGDQDKYLRGNGTWHTPSGSGGSSAAILLNYVAASDIMNNTTLTADVWTNFDASRTITVGSTGDILLVFVSGGAIIRLNANTAIASRLNVDNGASFHMIGSEPDTASGAFQGENPFTGANAIVLTGLSSGTHTLQVQVIARAATGAAFCRPATVPTTEFFAIRVVKL